MWRQFALGMSILWRITTAASWILGDQPMRNTRLLSQYSFTATFVLFFPLPPSQVFYTAMFASSFSLSPTWYFFTAMFVSSFPPSFTRTILFHHHACSVFFVFTQLIFCHSHVCAVLFLFHPLDTFSQPCLCRASLFHLNDAYSPRFLCCPLLFHSPVRYFFTSMFVSPSSLFLQRWFAVYCFLEVWAGTLCSLLMKGILAAKHGYVLRCFSIQWHGVFPRILGPRVRVETMVMLPSCLFTRGTEKADASRWDVMIDGGC